jgi:ADP-heptose:LPS heptosyltransferase
VKRLLVVRLSAFSDVIHTIPAVVALREHFDIEWVVRPAYRVLRPLIRR